MLFYGVRSLAKVFVNWHEVYYNMKFKGRTMVIKEHLANVTNQQIYNQVTD